MKAHSLPRRTILVIEDEDLRYSLTDDLRPFADEVLDYTDSAAAIQSLTKPPAACQHELMLVVGDRVAIPFMSSVGIGRRLYPYARKILYSGGASDSAVKELKQAGVVDSFVPKGYPHDLMNEVRRSIGEYQAIEVLTEIRAFAESGCSNPLAPYYPVDDGRVLNIIDVYREIMLGTTLGAEAAESWMEMRRLEVLHAAR